MKNVYRYRKIQSPLHRNSDLINEIIKGKFIYVTKQSGSEADIHIKFISSMYISIYHNLFVYLSVITLFVKYLFIDMRY